MSTTAIPHELAERPQWVVWRWEDRSGKATKPPYNAITGNLASSTDPDTWTTYEKALAASENGDWKGIGFVFAADDPFVGVDLDKCHNAVTGEIDPKAREIVDALDSYTEISPSRTGLHVICQGSLPPGGRKRGTLEIYDSGRYFCVTGEHLEGTPRTIEERPEELAALHARYFGKPEAGVGAGAEISSLGDAEILEKARTAKDGAKFTALMGGDWTGYPSQSEADAALCVLLAFRTGKNADRVDRLFRQSGLYRPKWDERHYGDGRTYGQATIEAALNLSQDTYKPRAPSDKGATLDDDHGEADRFLIDAGDGSLPRVATLAWKAIVAANDPPVLYRRGGIPVWMEANDDGGRVIREVTPDRMRFRVARIANWYRDLSRRGGKGKRVEALPPIAVVRDLLVTPDPPLPVLNRIVEAPVYGPDGTLQTEPGYDPSSRTYYAPEENFRIDDLPNTPTSEEVTAARTLLLDDLLVDFPFVGDAEKAHAVALMILPFVRDMIPEPTPLHLIEKPTPGTGGSLLADVLTIPALGRPASAMTEARDEDEWRKRITARLMGGPSIIVIDNLHRRLESAALAAAITLETWEDRILGRSETILLPVRCAWVAIGNNPALSGEIARRTVRIRMDAKMDRPWQRKDFRHPKLRRWAKQHRPELVGAILIMVNAWLAAGRPTGTASLGGSEAWSDTIGGILATAGIVGFLTNLEDLYEQSDAEGAAWRAFLEAWWDKYEDKPVGVTDLWNLIDKGDLPIDLGKGGEHGQRVNLGRDIKSRRDRQFGDLRIIVDAKSKGHAQQCRLEKVSLG